MPLPPPHSLADEPDTVTGTEVRARLARRDPSDWPWILGELRGIANGLAPAFRDLCGADDVLGELALRAHERWIEDWLASGGKVSARVFLRDRLRDHLRELRRQKERRGALLRGAVPSGALVETESGTHEALLVSAPARPDESLEAAQLQRQISVATGAQSQLLELRAAGFEQHEIAARTGLSRPTVGRRLAAIATVLTALVSAGALVLAHGTAETELIRDAGSDGARRPRSLQGGAPPAAPAEEAASPLAAPDPTRTVAAPDDADESAVDADESAVDADESAVDADESAVDADESADDADESAVDDEARSSDEPEDDVEAWDEGPNRPLKLPPVFAERPTPRAYLPSDEASTPAFHAERVERLRVALGRCRREPGARVRLELIPMQEESLGVSGIERACVVQAVRVELRRGRPHAFQSYRYRVDEDRGVHFEARGSTPITAAIRRRPAPPRPFTLDELTRGASPESDAQSCLVAGDFACVIRILGEGRARTASQLWMLTEAQRRRTGVRSSCGTLETLLEHFPRSREAARARLLAHAAGCPGR
jgi:cell division protein FtsN